MKVVKHNITDKDTKVDASLYAVLVKIPSVPKRFNLTTQQKYWWKWFAKSFVATKQFTEADLIHLQKASFWLDARCQALELINLKNTEGNLKGMVQTFKGGATNITGYMSIIKDADKALDDLSAHFGMSIRDRKRLGEEVKVDPNQLSLFEQFKNRNKAQ